MWFLVLGVVCLDCTVDEVYVEVAVAVVVKKPATGSEEFVEKP